MTDDIYLSLAAELFEKGTWSKEVFIKRVMLYAKEKNISEDLINEYIARVTKTKEYTIEEKKRFLSVVTLDGKELKYGDVINSMSDEMIEKIYQSEEDVLGKDRIDKFFEIEASKEKIIKEEENKEVAEPQKEPHRQVVKVVRKKVEASDLNDLNNKPEETPEKTTLSVEPEVLVVPPIDELEIKDMPDTEEEFAKQAENITKAEKDSNVTQVEVAPERIEKLKKNKGKVINYFLKTAIVVGSVILLNPGNTLIGVAGYLYFSNKIKKGEFNPENMVGKAIKKTVEKIMYMGMPKQELENEGSKVR